MGPGSTPGVTMRGRDGNKKRNKIMKEKNIYKILDREEQNILAVDDIKNYARISIDDDDLLIKEMIEAAIIAAENFMRTALVKQTVEVTGHNTNSLLLPIMPLIKILEVKCGDKILDENDYHHARDRISLESYGKTVAKYSAGYEDPKDIPAIIKQALLVHISQMYDSRGGTSISDDRIFDLYKPYRKMLV